MGEQPMRNPVDRLPSMQPKYGRKFLGHPRGAPHACGNGFSGKPTILCNATE